MRKYELYLIEKEVAYHYFGREHVLYHFFVEASHPVPHLKDTVERQLVYITKTIPYHVFDYEVKRVDAQRKGYKTQKAKKELVLFSKTSKAILRSDGRKLSLTADGNFEAETLMFEHLRKLESSFLAINFEGKSIGWLSPVKQALYI